MNTAFERVIGYEDLKRELELICDVIRNYEKYKSFGVATPKGLLLYGEPGVGKSLVADCLIEDTKRPVFVIRKDRPDGDFVNSIRETFQKAKDAQPSIVLLDDMDKFANEDWNHRDAEEYVAVQSCIDDVKKEEVFIIATVNDKDSLPDSLIRAGRFDKVIEMEAPMGKDAEQIIAHYLRQKKRVGNVDIHEIARLLEGHSCAELESVINEAGMYAVYGNREKIEQEDLLKACMRIIFRAPECVNPEKTKYLERVALHEAGHAVIAEVLRPGSVNLVSICRHKGEIEGITSTKPQDGFKLSYELMEEKVLGLLGGKAALEIVMGIPDVGCGGDMRKTYEIMDNLVSLLQTEGFYGSRKEGYPSEYILGQQNRVVNEQIERYYAKAKLILAENRRFLDEMAALLMEKQTITYRDIAALRERNCL